MKRHPNSPILSRAHLCLDDPMLQDVTSVFNPGVIYHKGQIIALLRVQDRGRRTHLVKATSLDGVNFQIAKNTFPITGLEAFSQELFHIYDPRIVRLEDSFYISCAVDCTSGCLMAIFKSEDMESMHFIGTLNDAQHRNGVLFDQKIEGRYWMLSRPNEHTGPDGVKSGTRIFAYSSSDFRSWKEEAFIMEGRFHFWDELIGSGPPPILTPLGWLHIYHGVATHFGGSGIYQAGVCILDAKDPRKLLARGELNVLEPREIYECTGQVPNVVFPTACISNQAHPKALVGLDENLFIYYGAADTCIGLAISTPRELMEKSNINYKAFLNK